MGWPVREVLCRGRKMVEEAKVKSKKTSLEFRLVNFVLACYSFTILCLAVGYMFTMMYLKVNGKL